jgi:glycine/D-amino acid oxidase-like deaminating enzyme
VGLHHPWFTKKVVPLYTYIVLTEPLDAVQWAAVGWDRSQGIEDKRNFVNYYRRTLDGRILWGGSDGIVYPESTIKPAPDLSSSAFARLERTFPQLHDVRCTHRWGGPVAITVSFMPLFGTLLDGGLG